MARLLAGLVLAALVMLASPAAFALQCQEESQRAAFGSADVVAIAKATSTSMRDASSGVTHVILEVTRPLKGTPGTTVEVEVAGFKGGFQFERGRSYLVFAKRDASGLLWVYDCGGTVDLANGRDALALVEAELAKGPAPTPSASTPISPTPAASVEEPAAPEPAPAPSTEPALLPAEEPPVALPPARPSSGCASCTVGGRGEVGDRSAALAALLVVAFLARRRRKPGAALVTRTCDGRLVDP